MFLSDAACKVAHLARVYGPRLLFWIYASKMAPRQLGRSSSEPTYEHSRINIQDHCNSPRSAPCKILAGAMLQHPSSSRLLVTTRPGCGVAFPLPTLRIMMYSCPTSAQSFSTKFCLPCDSLAQCGCTYQLGGDLVRHPGG